MSGQNSSSQITTPIGPHGGFKHTYDPSVAYPSTNNLVRRSDMNYSDDEEDEEDK